jgi:hypothetical protein
MKKVTHFILCLIIAHFTSSQGNGYYNRMNHVFGNIQKTKVTTGLLKEFGIRWNEVEAQDDFKLLTLK